MSEARDKIAEGMQTCLDGMNMALEDEGVEPTLVLAALASGTQQLQIQFFKTVDMEVVSQETMKEITCWHINTGHFADALERIHVGGKIIAEILQRAEDAGEEVPNVSEMKAIRVDSSDSLGEVILSMRAECPYCHESMNGREFMEHECPNKPTEEE
jgi:hypothetical protein